MTFKNLYIDHERSSEAEEWVKEELAEQEERFATNRSSSAKRLPTLQELNAAMDAADGSSGNRGDAAPTLNLKADTADVPPSLLISSTSVDDSAGSSSHRPRPQKELQEKSALSPSREAGKGRHSI